MRTSSHSLHSWFLLILLAALWGGSFIFIRIAAPVMGSMVLMGFRMVVATAVMVAYAIGTKTKIDFRTRWKEYLALGALNNAIPFVLIANSVIDLNASISAIINATTPLFTALAATIWLREPFGSRRAAGVFAGIAGVVILVGFSPIPLTARSVWAASQSLLAALAYGLGAVYSRSRFQNQAPTTTSVGQFIGSTLVLVPFSAAGIAQAEFSLAAILAALTLACVGTSFAYLLYFRLINTTGPTATTSVTFLVPFFSILWGVLFLNEPLNLGMFAGLGIILLSVRLVMFPAGRTNSARLPSPSESSQAKTPQ